MKVFDVHESTVHEGIQVAMEPYPHIVLGEGGHKRAAWIALGKRDAESIIERTPIMERRWNSEKSEYEMVDTGRKSAKIKDVGIIALRNKETGELNGKFLIVAPRNGHDNRALVLWRVSSGYRGSASISAGEGVTLIASDSSWHSGRGSLGETAETLAILKEFMLCEIQENIARLGFKLERVESEWAKKRPWLETFDSTIAKIAEKLK